MAAKAVGTSHLRTNLPCQDWFVCSTQQADWILIAVADGAGSASRSERGAELATSCVVAEMLAALAEGGLTCIEAARRSIIKARELVMEEAVALQLQPRELACTLLFVAMGPGGGVACQIGDGLVAVKPNSDDWVWVFWPQRGEYANVTHFLTDDDALTVLELDELGSDIDEFAVLTDGLEPLALHYATRSTHTRFFEGMIAPLRAASGDGHIAELSAKLEEFLTSDRVRERADDDLSIVLATNTTT